MKQECKNCNSTVELNYCQNCGQKTHTGRINFRYWVHELQHSIFHVDRGIFYTIKELAIRPGYTIKEYLEGKRVRHFKPFAFIVITATIYAFISNHLDMKPNETTMALGDEIAEKSVIISNILYEWVYSHYSLYLLFCIPFFSLGSFIMFRKYKYNYFEHLTLNTYLTGGQMIIYLLLLPLNYFFSMGTYLVISLLISSIYMIWSYIQFFYSGKKTVIALKGAASIIISSVLCIFILTLLVLMLFIYL